MINKTRTGGVAYTPGHPHVRVADDTFEPRSVESSAVTNGQEHVSAARLLNILCTSLGHFAKHFYIFYMLTCLPKLFCRLMMMGMRIVDCGLYAIASPPTSREIIQPTEKVLPLKCAKELERNQSVVVLLRHHTMRRFVAFAAQVVQIS